MRPASPTLTRPTLVSVSELRSNPVLLNHLTAFINAAFFRSHARFPDQWSQNPAGRFSSPSELLQLLGTLGVMCVVYDNDEAICQSMGDPGLMGVDSKGEATAVSDSGLRQRKIVACAGAIPWTGASHEKAVQAPAGTEKEAGWEIKVVCVDDGLKYKKTGLAVNIVEFLGEWLATNGSSDEPIFQNSAKKLNLWIITPEMMQGAYWRRRGFQEVRRGWADRGTWGCLKDFEMIVLKKEVLYTANGF